MDEIHTAQNWDLLGKRARRKVYFALHPDPLGPYPKGKTMSWSRLPKWFKESLLSPDGALVLEQVLKEISL